MSVIEATPATLAARPRTVSLPISIQRLPATVTVGVLIGMPWIYSACFPLGCLGYSWLFIRAASVTPSRAYWESFATGAIALSIAFHWAPHSIFGTTNLSFQLSVVVFAGLILWEAIAFAMIGWVTNRLHQWGSSWIWCVVPAWLTIETQWPRVFSWSTAHAYLGFPPLLQVAELAGTSGVTACALLGSVAITRVWLGRNAHRAWLETALVIGLLVAVCLWGQVTLNHWHERILNSASMAVAAVQVDPTPHESLAKMQSLSSTVAGQVDLLLWPESTLGNYDISLEHFRDQAYVINRCEAVLGIFDPYPAIHCDLLAGGKTYDDGGRDHGPYRNTAFLIDRDKSVSGRYVKRSLMPIGEYVPGERWLPVLRDWAAVSTELIRGASDAPLTLSSGRRVGMLVCYEDMVAKNAASSVREGAECLIALANGSAFKDPDTLEQHLKLAQLRAVENRRSLVRCAATGVSCLVLPDGTVAKRLPIGEDGILIVDVPLESRLTFYTRHGDWLATISVVMSFAVIVLALLHRPSPSRNFAS